MTNGRRLLATSTLLASVSLVHAQSWTGWHAEAWANLRLTNAEAVAMAAVVNGPFALTNYLAPYPSTNSTTSLITFLSDIEPLPVGPAIITNIWTFNVYNAGGTNVSEIRTNVAAQVATNLNLQARDILAFDSYLADLERFYVMPIGTIEKPRYYRGYRDALVYIKARISAQFGSYVATNWTAPATYTNAPYVVVWSNDFLTGFPSNCLTYTPYRDLHLSAGSPRVITGTFTWATSSTNVITNTVQDSCGNLVTISGTNGQVTTFVCTNANIEAGYTSGSYGWGPITTLYARMVRTATVGGLYGTSKSASYSDLFESGIDYTLDPPQLAADMITEYDQAHAGYPWTTATNTVYVLPTEFTYKSSEARIGQEWEPMDSTEAIQTEGWIFQLTSAKPSILLNTNAVNVLIDSAYVYTPDLYTPTSGYARLYNPDIVAVPESTWDTASNTWARETIAGITGQVVTTESVFAPNSQAGGPIGNELAGAIGKTGALFKSSTTYQMAEVDQPLFNGTDAPSEGDSGGIRKGSSISVMGESYWIIKWDYKYR